MKDKEKQWHKVYLRIVQKFPQEYIGRIYKRWSILYDKNPARAKTYFRVLCEKRSSSKNLRELNLINKEESTKAAINFGLVSRDLERKKPDSFLEYEPSKYILIANRGEIAYRMIKEAHLAGKKIIILREEKDIPWENLINEDDLEIVISSYCSRGESRKKRADIIEMEEIVKPTLEKEGIKLNTVAVFTGYGFNSEDEIWIEHVENMGFRICGPSSDSIKAFGVKTKANKAAAEAGLNPPLTSGSIMYTPSMTKEARERNIKIGLDFYKENKNKIKIFLLKDARGGGGSGQLKLVAPTYAQFEEHLRKFAATKEIVEFSVDEFIEGTRHVEFQVASDMDGSIVVIGYRDCSEQLQMQKIIEESANHIPKFARENFKIAIVKFFKKLEERVGHPYVGLATVETMYQPSARRANKFRFLEVNPRPQVEIPVTELQSGFNLIASLIQIVDGKKLKSQEEIEAEDVGGVSIEARITLQEIFSEEMLEMMQKQGKNKILCPSAGVISDFKPPKLPNVVVHYDPRLKKGVTVTGKYDPMIAKIVVHADQKAFEAKKETRRRAIFILKNAVQEFKIYGKGLKTNKNIITRILEHDVFINRNHRSQTVAASVVASMRVKSVEKMIKQTMDPYNLADPLYKLLCFVNVGALTESQKKVFNSFIFNSNLITVLENRVQQELEILKNKIKIDILRQKIVIWMQENLQENHIVEKVLSFVTKGISCKNFLIFPEAFGFLEIILEASGMNPSAVIVNYSERKQVAKDIISKKRLYDPLYFNRLLSNSKGRNILRGLSKSKKTGKIKNFVYEMFDKNKDDYSQVKEYANPKYNILFSRAFDVMNIIFPKSFYKNNIFIDEGQESLFFMIFFILTGVEFEKCFKDKGVVRHMV